MIVEKREPMEKQELILSGHATDLIWAMQHDEDLFGLRVDCGDSGTLFMSKAQAQEIISTLQGIISDKGIVKSSEGFNGRMPTHF